MNKKAIELSVNFLVIVILSIVMLTSGVLLIKQFFGTATDLEKTLDDRTVSHIEDLLDEGDYVAIPVKRKEIQRGDSQVFGLGILNINSNAPTKTFTIVVEFKRLITKGTEDIIEDTTPDFDPNTWTLYQDSVLLGYNEKKVTQILVEIPKNAPPGQYIYNVNIPEYQRLTKIYAIVP